MYGLTNYRKGDFDIFDPFKGFFDNMSADPCRTDIRDEGDRFIMESELPGFNKEDISVDISGNSLTLKAEHKAENEEKKEGKYIRRERSYGTYERSFDITGIDSDKITADYKNGILIMVLPKKQPEAPASKKLTIN